MTELTLGLHLVAVFLLGMAAAWLVDGVTE